MSTVTYERIRELFDYDQETGELIRKVSVSSRAMKGMIAGCKHRQSDRDYWTISVSIDSKKYLAHRVIWCFMTGQWPINEIDHKDGYATNNRWDNLREATHSEGAKNRGRSKSSTTGVKGVYLTKNRKFRVSITVDRKEIRLGRYDTLEEATMVRHAASIKYHGKFARLE